MEAPCALFSRSDWGLYERQKLLGYGAMQGNARAEVQGFEGFKAFKGSMA